MQTRANVAYFAPVSATTQAEAAIARLPTKPAAALPRGGAAWADERGGDRGDIRVMQGFSALRAQTAAEQSQTCAACGLARVAEGADDALCDEHLSLALGMNSDW